MNVHYGTITTVLCASLFLSISQLITLNSQLSLSSTLSLQALPGEREKREREDSTSINSYVAAGDFNETAEAKKVKRWREIK